MLGFLGDLTVIQQALAYIAVPSTVILLLQTILTLVGMGHGGAGVSTSDTSGLDLNADANMNFDSGHDLSGAHHGIDDGSALGDFSTMRLFTLQGIVAFFAVFSWSSIVMISFDIMPVVAVLLGLVFGLCTMYLVAKILRWSAKLVQNGNLILERLVGASGSVYLTIPAKGQGQGKVTVTSEERFVELMAITENDKAIKTGASVKVVDIRGDLLVVESIDKQLKK